MVWKKGKRLHFSFLLWHGFISYWHKTLKSQYSSHFTSSALSHLQLYLLFFCWSALIPSVRFSKLSWMGKVTLWLRQKPHYATQHNLIIQMSTKMKKSPNLLIFMFLYLARTQEHSKKKDHILVVILNAPEKKDSYVFQRSVLSWESICFQNLKWKSFWTVLNATLLMPSTELNPSVPRLQSFCNFGVVNYSYNELN